FFFQAEDGIRDLIVTGVQTCALPISCRWRVGVRRLRGDCALRLRRLAAGRPPASGRHGLRLGRCASGLRGPRYSRYSSCLTSSGLCCGGLLRLRAAPARMARSAERLGGLGLLGHHLDRGARASDDVDQAPALFEMVSEEPETTEA